jgi:ATP-dependent protease Clp ATPase subunit
MLTPLARYRRLYPRVARSPAKRSSARPGARDLRSILESIPLETMFDLPGLEGVEVAVISREVSEGTARPLYIYADRSGGKQRHGVLTPPN